MIDIYGLSRPYDFNKAIPFLVSLLLLVFILVLGILLATTGRLNIGTPRWYFLVYVGLTLLLGGGISFYPKLAWCLFAIAFLEISLSMSTYLLNKAHIGRSLFPRNSVSAKPQFMYHPLLQGTPTPNFEGEGEIPGVIIKHNKYGLRGASLPARADGKIVIATIGGSTTYDIGVSQGSTWPEMLQKELGDKYLILNFAVPGYSTSEHVIQTAFYLEKTGLKPSCAIYFIGANDIRNSHIPHLDEAYANFHLLSQLGNLQTRKQIEAIQISPLLKILYPTAQRLFDTVPLPPDYKSFSPSAEIDKRLEVIYRRNIRSIAAINNANGIKSIFIGQLLNRTDFKADKVTGSWVPLIKEKDIPAAYTYFNGVLLDESRKTDSTAIILRATDFDDSDFVDSIHFSKKGTIKFASEIAPKVSAVCGL